MNQPLLRVRHVYAHDRQQFEAEVNEALARIVEHSGVVADIRYSIDPSSHENARIGFGALILFELPESTDDL